jgi:hypothetical protein
VFSAVAPPVVFEGKSLAGILPAIDLLSVNALVGVRTGLFFFANYISILRYVALNILIKIIFILSLMQNIIIHFG